MHLAMVDGLSGAYEMACGLRDQARHPERVHVLNTRTLCVPHRALACYAVKLAAQGLGAAEVVGRLEAMMGTARSCLIPEDFDYLRRGGRLTPLAAATAAMTFLDERAMVSLPSLRPSSVCSITGNALTR